MANLVLETRLIVLLGLENILTVSESQRVLRQVGNHKSVQISSKALDSDERRITQIFLSLYFLSLSTNVPESTAKALDNSFLTVPQWISQMTLSWS